MKKGRMKRVIAVLLTLIMVLTSVNLPSAAVEVKAAGTSTKTTANVLFWTSDGKTQTEVSGYIFDIMASRFSNDVSSVFEKAETAKYAGLTSIKYDNTYITTPKHFDKTSDLSNYDMVIVFASMEITDTDIEVLRKYINAGGRVVFQAENNSYVPNYNKLASKVAKQLGASFEIASDDESTIAEAVINEDCDVIDNRPLDGTITHNLVARIQYSEPAQVVASTHDNNWPFIVDMAAGKGRLTVISDIDWYIGENLNNAACDLWGRLLSNSIANMELVADGGNPNHTHNWKYSVDGNTISAYCDSDDKSCKEQGKIEKLTLSSADDLVYDGKRKDAVIEDNLSKLTKAIFGEITYKGTGDTVYEASTTAPTDVGTYKASVTVTPKNGDTAYTAETEFEITKGTPEAAVTPLSDLVYTGEAQKLVAGSASGGTLYYRLGESGEWSIEVPTAISADSSPYDVYYYVKGDSNHNDIGSEDEPCGTVKATIGKKTFPKEVIQSEDAEFPYDGESHTIADVTLEGEALGATVTYSAEADGEYTADKPEFSAVGDHAVYYKVSKPEYADYMGSQHVEITPKKVSVTWSDTELTYNGTKQGPTAVIEASQLIGDDTCEVEYAGAQTKVNGVDGSDAVYTAKVTGLSNSNYVCDEETSSVEFEIVPKEIGIDWTDLTFTYDATAHIPTATATGLIGDDECTIAVEGQETDRGSYTATAVNLSNHNYKLPEDCTKGFVINPKPFKENVTITLFGEGLSQDEDGNYYYSWDNTDKQPEIIVTEKDTGKVLERDKDYTVSGDQKNSTLGKHTFRILGTGNYGTGRLDRVSVTWNIVKAEIKPVLNLEAWTYGEKANEPEITGTKISGDVTYTYYKDEECTVKTNKEDGAKAEGEVPANVGTYYVKADIAETENYNATSVSTSFTINKKAITVVPKAGQSKIYGQADPVIAYEADLVGDDTLTGALVRVKSDDVTASENAGEYAIKEDPQHPFAAESNPNYDITVKTDGVVFTIERKEIKANMITVTPFNYPYTGKENTPNLELDDTTHMQIGSCLTKQDIQVEGDIKGADYGIYTIYVYGRGNYKGVATKKWCVSPVKDTTIVYDGQPQSVAVLDAAQDGVFVKFKDEDGEYTLDAPQTYVEPRTYEYEYQMTIDEGDDETSTVEGQATLVIKKMDSIAKIWLEDEYTFDDEYEPEVIDNPENGSVSYTYYGIDSDGNITDRYDNTKPVNAGKYRVKAYVGETAHYYDTILQKDYVIKKHDIEDSEPIQDVFGRDDSGEKTVSIIGQYEKLYGDKYKVAKCVVGEPTGDTSVIDGNVTVDNKGNLLYKLAGGVTEDKELTIPVTVTSTNYEDVVINYTVHIDATAPTGEIKIADHTWKKFLNHVTFGHFFKENQKVTIQAEDAGVGVDSIYYYVADAELSLEEVSALKDEDWNLYEDSFDITKDSTNVVYAKLVDKAGNTSVINSEGVVIYTDSEQETEELTFVRTSKDDLKAKVRLNGNTIKSITNGDATLTTRDPSSDVISVVDYTVDNATGEITFTNAYLKSLAAGDYKLTLSYNPRGKEFTGGEDSEAPATTSIDLHVVKDEGSVTEISDIGKAYDAKPVDDVIYKTTNSCGDQNEQVTVAYKKAEDPDSEYTTDKPADAGFYTVRITVAVDDDYLEAVGESEFEIAPRQVIAKVVVGSKIYDGTTDAAVESASVDTGIEGQNLTIQGITASFADKNVGKKKKIEFDDSNIEVTGDDNTNPNNYDVLVSRNQKSADIEPLQLTDVTWGDTELVYTGSKQAPSATAVGVVDGDECNIVVEGAQTDTNAVTGEETYVATATGTDNANYVLPATNLTCEYTIVNASQDAPEVTVQNETILGKADGKMDGLTTDMEYRKVSEDEQAGEFTKVTDVNMSFAVGTYEVRYAAKPNYDASDVTKVVIEQGRKLTITLPTKQAGYTLTADKEDVEWNGEANLEFTAADGYSVTEDFAVKANGKELTFDENGKYTLDTIEDDVVITVEFLTLSKRQDAAKTALNKKQEEALAELEALTDLTQEQKESAEKSIRDTIEAAIAAIDKAEDGITITDKSNTAISDVEQIVEDAKELDLSNAKETAKEAISKKADEAKATVDAMPNLTAEEKKTAKEEIDTKAASVKAEIDKITSYTEKEEIETKKSEGESLLDVLVEKAAGNDLANLKEAVKAEIDSKAEAAKEAVDALADLTAEEKQAAKDSIASTADKAKQTIEDATTNEGVKTSGNEAIKAIDTITENAKNTDLSNAKETAKEAISKKADEAKATVDAMPNLTEEEKKTAKEEIDTKAASVKAEIDKITSYTEKEEIETKKSEGDSSLEALVEKAAGNDLANLKEAAKTEIDSKAETAKEAVDALADLTEEEKQAVRDSIDSTADKVKQTIAAATTTKEVKAASSEVTESIDKIAENAKKSDLTNAKEAAKEAISKNAEEAKAAIDEMTDLTAEEKEVAKADIDKKVKEAKDALETVTDIAKKSDVETNKDAGIKAVETIKTEATAKDLSYAKDKATSVIDSETAEAKKAVDKLTNLTEEEKQAAKDSIDAIAKEAKQKISESVSRDEVTKTETDSNKDLNKFVTEKKVEDYNKTKDDNTTGTVNVTIKGENANPDATYNVSLKLGNTVVEKKENVKADAVINMDRLPDGVYSLVVSDENDNQSTTMVIVSKGNITAADVSVGPKNTTVEVKRNAPNVAVGGMEKIYNTDVYTQDAKTVVENDGKVDLKLTVQGQEEDTDIVNAISDDKTVGEFVDYNVEMIVTNSNGETYINKVNDTKQLILLAKPLSDSEKNRSGYALFRKHNDGQNEKVEALPMLEGNEKVTPSQEGFYVENGYLYVWANKFSVYALAYDKVTKVDPEPTPDPNPTPSTPETPSDGRNDVSKPAESNQNNDKAPSNTVTVSEKQQQKNALSLNAGLKVSQTKNQINVIWGKVSGATGYDVYVQYCGMDFTEKSVTNVGDGTKNKVIIKKINGKKINLKKNYKIYVEAYKTVDGHKVILGKTIMAHIVGKNNATQTNPKAVKLSKTSYTLSKGKIAKIEAKTVLVDKNKKPLSDAHAKEFRYATDNKKVATVSKKGLIKAVGKGNCVVYVYARNGYTKKIKVTVK